MNGVETLELAQKTEEERMNLENAISEVRAHFENLKNGSVAINNFVMDLNALVQTAQDLQSKVSNIVTETKMIKKMIKKR